MNIHQWYIKTFHELFIKTVDDKSYILMFNNHLVYEILLYTNVVHDLVHEDHNYGEFDEQKYF